MRKSLFFIILVMSGISCGKSMDDLNAQTPDYIPPPGTQFTTGTLLYACVCLDGGGLLYGTDNHKTLLFEYKNRTDSFNNPTIDDSLQRVYKDFLGTHSRLTYKSTNTVRCVPGVFGCESDSVVEVVALTNL